MKPAASTLRKSSPPIDPRRARRADHGDRARLEERAERGGHREVVALVDPRPVLLGRLDREADLKLAAVQLPRHLEARRRSKTPSMAGLSDCTSRRNARCPGLRRAPRAARGAACRCRGPADRPRPRRRPRRRRGSRRRSYSPTATIRSCRRRPPACRRGRRGRASRARGNDTMSSSSIERMPWKRW